MPPPLVVNHVLVNSTTVLDTVDEAGSDNTLLRPTERTSKRGKYTSVVEGTTGDTTAHAFGSAHPHTKYSETIASHPTHE
jgi:hypothetical protein